MSVSTQRLVLVVEDEDLKYADIVDAVANVARDFRAGIVRASSATEAETAMEREDVVFVVLDISLNISPGSLGPLRGGFANLGGMDVAEKMYLIGRSIPTVVVTGFDYFPSPSSPQSSLELIGLSDIETMAREFLGEDLLGCIRYASDGWKEALAERLREVLKP